MRTRREKIGKLWIFPREHGAWALVAFPFVSAVILAGSPGWLILPAALSVLAAFSIREPLIALGRRLFIWRRQERDEPALEIVFLALSSTTLAASVAVLFMHRDWHILLALGMAALVLLVVAVALAVLNLQRSVWLQIVGAIGLSAAALVGWLSGQPRLGLTAWWLWLVHSAYSVAAVLVVRAKLDARKTIRRPEQNDAVAPSLRSAVGAQVVLLLIGAFCLGWGPPLLALPLTVAAGVHFVNLWSLRRPASHAVPLRQIGLRALGLSAVYSMMVVIALW